MNSKQTITLIIGYFIAILVLIAVNTKSPPEHAIMAAIFSLVIACFICAVTHHIAKNHVGKKPTTTTNHSGLPGTNERSYSDLDNDLLDLPRIGPFGSVSDEDHFEVNYSDRSDDHESYSPSACSTSESSYSCSDSSSDYSSSDD